MQFSFKDFTTDRKEIMRENVGGVEAGCGKEKESNAYIHLGISLSFFLRP
jgi:hypothetical protein